ncbi:cell envelope integrity protein CreD [Pseudoxanthomonas winnipegensis]|uniref:cell envelope integrity protein CreD n=1 Tax=Pseudoxanthomonas winnipegensis TaxID=2480810 RepID=UPI00102DA14C|nr:cell envelope integrity protein CreD [Pseudoxanthomonas winnipegensis]RZZ83471.1 cell envelope integrity protein CreD [Pseudoxanthomonas winnipegensis]
MKSLKLLLRLAIAGALVLALLIPLSMIRSLIAERTAYREQAVERVALSSAGAQRLVGPLRALPYVDVREQAWTDDTGHARTRQVRSEGTLLQAPLSLQVGGQLRPQTRRVGLFDVPTYVWNGQLSAQFSTALPPAPAGAVRRYGTPYLVLGLRDVRGLQGAPGLRVDGAALRLQPGTRAFNAHLAGVSALLPEVVDGRVPGRSVTLSFALAGTQALEVVPVADDSRVRLASPWPHPAFGGDFLPVQRTVGARGFDAQWAVSSLASQAQAQLQQLQSDGGTQLDALRVELVDPVDAYTLADRACKYGLLFVLLTFVGFGLLELVRRVRIHPLQYLLVGLALAMFFLLLFSLSEHIAFWLAYLIAAGACIGVQFVYLAGVLRSPWLAGGFALALTALYGALYGLLMSEDNALLMGSLLLFAILAAIMWITRRIDWYALSTELR